MVQLSLLYYTTPIGNSSATFSTVIRDDKIICIIAKIENTLNIGILIV
jgi:hypothetical protein